MYKYDVAGSFRREPECPYGFGSKSEDEVAIEANP